MQIARSNAAMMSAPAVERLLHKADTGDEGQQLDAATTPEMQAEITAGCRWRPASCT